MDEELSRVPASVCRQVACTGAVQRISIDRRGRITALETPARVFGAHQRRAIAARDGHCVIPGCRVPATWCEVHHVQEWAQGGHTTTDNGVLLCWFHHRSLDTSGWRIRMVEGVPQVSSPTWIDPQQTWTAAEQSQALHHRGLRERLAHPTASRVLEDPGEAGGRDDPGGCAPVESHPAGTTVWADLPVSHPAPSTGAWTLRGVLTSRGTEDWKHCVARVPGLSPPWEEPWWGHGPETHCRTG